MTSELTVEIGGGVALAARVAAGRGRSIGTVVFAHGSGSSRFSSRNRAVAEQLNERGLGTVLLDLLTPAEERVDAVTREHRFDIAMLAGRVGAVVRWIDAGGLDDAGPVGLFGASTGAAAALIAAAAEPTLVAAVVSRGGRTDLAGGALESVQAPTLLIVGERDVTVLAWNRETLTRLRCRSALRVIPGASHLFEEPGALGDVARLAGTWFEDELGSGLG